MPQLDFSVFPSQMFWLVVSFFVMFFVMNKFIIPKTAEMINLRKEKIDNDLEKADEIKKLVEETLEKYNNALQNANNKAAISLQKTREELNDTVARRQEELSLRLRAEIEESERKIELAKNRAISRIEEDAPVLVVEILTKLGFSGINIKDAADIVNVLKEK